MKKLLIITALLLSIALPTGVLAADAIQFKPSVTIPGSQFQAGQSVNVKNNTTTLCDYIIAYYKYGMAIIGILAVVSIAAGGLLWVVSAGNSGSIKKAQERIKDALLGVGLLLGSFLILATINKDLVVCKNIVISSIAKQEISALVPPLCHFESKAKNVSPACQDGFIADADQKKCLFKDGIPNGEFSNNNPGLVNYCCCPNSMRMANAAFCDDQEEGATCIVGGGWGFCETQSDDSKVCRACKMTRREPVTKENVSNTPERERCYRNSKNWECRNDLGWCGKKAVGNDCVMEYVYKNPDINDDRLLGLLATGQLVQFAANKTAEWFVKSVGTGVLPCWGNGSTIAACYCR